MDSQIALSSCKDYSAVNVQQAVRQAVELLGGIQRFIKPGSRVLLKPNLLTAREPETGIVTHPEIVRAVIRLLKQINAKIYLGDSPSSWTVKEKNTELLWEKTGVKQVAEQEQVELVRFRQSRWQDKFPLTTWLDEVDSVVSLPKFKTHDLTILTGAVKNLFGLIPGRYKIELHKKYFSPKAFAGMLVDLYEAVKPSLTIVDGVLALEGEGPSSRGIKRNVGVIVAGRDCVSIDSVLAFIMGLNPEDILTTKEASRRQLGISALRDIQILGQQPGLFTGGPFKLPLTNFKYHAPKFFVEFFKKVIRFYPFIDPQICTKCGVCINACPVKVIKEQNGILSIDYSGCISCFCCQEVCPSAAIGIKRSLVANLLRL